jgi:pyruvate, water dikinase
VAAALSKFKNWFSRKSRSSRPLSLGPPPELLARYLQYKRLLAANSAILAVVADLQAKVNEGSPFDVHYVRQACERLDREVETLVAALMAMSGGRYTGLEAIRRQVAQRLADDLAVGIRLTPGPLALPLKEVQEGMFFGDKAEKLGELTRLGFKVPAGFGVSAYAQKLFFEATDLEAYIRRAISQSHIRDLESLREAGEAIRARIMAQELPEELAQAISSQLAGLPSDRVAVRSSPLQEGSQFSFAGQFETILNVTVDQVRERYKEVIASQFTPRSLYYCHTSGFSYQELAMGVVVMEMVAAVAAGVLYTDDPRGGGAAIINAVCGLGSLAVGGVVAPDIYRVEEDRLVTSHVGEKTRMHVPAPQGGLLDLEVPAERLGPCLMEDQVLTLTALGRRVRQHFYLPQDIEWALGADENFYLLQARPLRVGRQLRTDYPPPRIKGAQVLLENGIVASRGVAFGVVHHLKDGDLGEIPAGVVLVTSRAGPEYAVAVGRAAAVVSEAGSAVGHLATVLREARLPAVFGARGALSLLRAGDLVTVDACYGNVYAGRVEELLKAPRGGGEVVRQSRAFKVLERSLRHITPLNLMDPRSEDFRPEACRTYHDITRFAHAKAMGELFQMSAAKLAGDGGRRLVSHLPLDLYLIDLGGGLSPAAAGLLQVRPEHLRSRPMLAYWKGVSEVGWQGPKPVDPAGFLSGVMGAATDTNVREKLHEKNFAIITDDYLNLSNLPGFHFATIESFLGTAADSYISLTFYGGGAEITRRLRRVRFLARVLEHLHFRVELKEDSITARADAMEPAALEGKLEILGRLMMVSKQLDLEMLDDEAADRCYQEFITEGHTLRRAKKPLNPS